MKPSKNRFELIEHTADTGLVASGSTLAEAFANAAYGMFSIIADLDELREVDSLNNEATRSTASECVASGHSGDQGHLPASKKQ